MKKTTKIVIVSVLAAIILLGIGYAAIGDISLIINGSAVASAEAANFSVTFNQNKETSVEVTEGKMASLVTAVIDTPENNAPAVTATLNIPGGVLSQKDDFVIATYPVINNSQDLAAELSIELKGGITEDNKDYFSVTPSIAGDQKYLLAGEETTVSVFVKLNKTPIDTDIPLEDLVIELVAKPTDPETIVAE